MQETTRIKLWLRTLILLFFDVVAIGCSGFIALWIRYDTSIGRIEIKYIDELIRVLPLILITYLVIYYIFRLYHSIWRFASVSELARIVGAYIALVPVIIVERYTFTICLPRSTYMIMYILTFMACVGVRFSYRFIRHLANHRQTARGDNLERVMVIGAGQAGRELVADISVSSRLRYQVVCIIDDNKGVWNHYLGSVPIVGGRDSIPEMVDKYDVSLILFAIPSISRKEQVAILDICRQTGRRIQIIPGMYQLANGEAHISALRDVEITDLLGRDEIEVDNDEIFAAIKGKVVLVTGGGGSIGSELCRQIALAQPKQLIIFDIYENNAYDIQQELTRRLPDLNLVTLIGSVRNIERLDDVMETYHPDLVYHAAAHKHVPMMEVSPNEAVKNNCLGTYNVAKSAAEHGVKRFLLISTDKAVNPTNVMGATKRICEMVIQMMDRSYPDTRFAAVRFGNVLGSNGSVIPLFKKQIAEGGPVTVTDPNIIRYFMTIPEAVALVLQASFYANGGEIFVLDMGEPVRIDDMARKMIELSGFEPDVDIDVVYTGLRPGEKLYEELLIDDEKRKIMGHTANSRIFVETPMPQDDESFAQALEMLGKSAYNEIADIRPQIQALVPTYVPDRDRQAEIN